MKNKYVYLTIGIIIILVVSFAAYIDLSSQTSNSVLSTSPTPSSSSTPSTTSTPKETSSSTPTTSPTATTVSTSSPTVPNQFLVTFTASGLDNSASSTIVTTSLGNVSYANMPFISMVNSGTQITFTYQSNVTTNVPNCLFTLTNAPTSSSLIVTAPTTINATYGRAIIDYSGTLVNLPPSYQINRIADSWPAHNTIIVMCGAGSKLVATSPTDTTITMFQYILPSMKTLSAPFDSSGNPNIEQLLADNPDIVFMSYSTSSNAAYQTMVNAGLCVVRLYFATFPDMTNTVQQTGWILWSRCTCQSECFQFVL